LTKVKPTVVRVKIKAKTAQPTLDSLELERLEMSSGILGDTFRDSLGLLLVMVLTLLLSSSASLPRTSIASRSSDLGRGRNVPTKDLKET
jgi:hypothetical protein